MSSPETAQDPAAQDASAPPAAQRAAAPRPPARPHPIAAPHGVRIDPYYWLRDDERQNGEVLDYLRAENAYKELQLAAIKPLEEKLYAEIIGRLKQDDTSVPYRKSGYRDYTRYEDGREHPIFA